MALKTLLLLAGASALAGCANQSKTAGTMPSPSFAAPTIAAAPVAVAPSPPRVPAKVAKASATPAPAPGRFAGTQTGPREWTPAAKPRAWRWVVVHHSATAAGGAAAFDKMHKAKGWDGLGYDFVIGNGTDTRDGQVEVGFRWKGQLTGAHAKTADNRFNEAGIGICLVGNFDVDRPTPAQMKSLARLTAHLMKTYRISPDRVIGHGDTKATDCPGRFMNVATVRKLAQQAVADAGDRPEPTARAATGELLTQGL